MPGLLGIILLLASAMLFTKDWLVQLTGIALGSVTMLVLVILILQQIK